MAPESGITPRQNEPRELLRLEAISRLHAKAGLLSAGTAASATALAIGGPVMAAANTLAQPWIGLVGVAFAAAQVLFLERREASLRQVAAAIQEQFDCYVLGLPWNPLAVDESPSDEILGAASESAGSAGAQRDVQNWYPADLDAVPESAARLIYQRAHLWSDSDLRKPYAVMLLAFSVAVPLLLAAWALGSGREIGMLLVLFAAGLPLVLWAGQEARAHNEAADRAQRLRYCAEDLWRDMIAELMRRASWDPIDDSRFLAASRSLQDQIYIHRRDSPTVPDWFYRGARERKERQTKAIVREWVSDYQRAKGA